MAKLIYAEKLDHVKQSGTLYSNNAWTTEARKGIIFTEDGYIVTHGKEFFIPEKLTLTNKTSVGYTVADDNKYQIKATKITFDEYGRYSKSESDSTVLDVNKITDEVLTKGTVEKTLYLLGSTSGTNKTTYYTPNKFSGLYATLGTDGKVTIHADNIAATSVAFDTGTSNQGKILYVNSSGNVAFTGGSENQSKVLVSGGDKAPSWKTILTSISAKSEDKDSLVTNDAVKTYVDNSFAANDAMVFKGTAGSINNLPVKGYSAGWTYRANASFAVGSEQCEVGDLIIAIHDAETSQSAFNSAHWTVAQTNIDGAVTAANNFTKNGIIISNGTSRTVESFAISTTAGQVLKTKKDDSGNMTLEWSTDIPNRAVKVDNEQKLSADSTDAINFIAGDHLSVTYDSGVKYSHNKQKNINEYCNSGLYKIAIDTYGHITSATTWTPQSLTISGYDASNKTTESKYNYDASSATTITADNGLKWLVSGNTATIGHTNDVTKQDTLDLYAIKYDAQGHITSSTKVTGGSNVTISIQDNTAEISSTDTNTWRPIYAYSIATNATLAEQLSNSSTNTKVLQFGSEFAYAENDTNGNTNTAEIHLAWAEIDDSGNITYSV